MEQRSTINFNINKGKFNRDVYKQNGKNTSNDSRVAGTIKDNENKRNLNSNKISSRQSNEEAITKDPIEKRKDKTNKKADKTEQKTERLDTSALLKNKKKRES